jgi:prepilin-type N-terminal cleavage/methylation domain-containing protein
MRGRNGFTLIEVMVALGVLALAIVPLLIEKGAVIRDTEDTRRRRHAWVLLSQKMAELEMDQTLLEQESTSGQGRFGDSTEYDAVYAEYEYAYESAQEIVTIPNPEGGDETQKEILRLTLTVSWPGQGPEKDRTVSLTGYFAVPEEEPQQP